MMCVKPVRGLLPCGQCLRCRINRRRKWVTRMMLESAAHPSRFCFFFTLTYADEHLPVLQNGSTLQKRHVQLWLKRLRARIYPSVLRYVLCGEYGPRSGRPHYHSIVWSDVDVSTLAVECWPYGFVSVSVANEQRMQYVMGYTVKKLTKSSDPRLLPGQSPEFVLRSQGIGRDFVDLVPESAAMLSQVRIGGKLMPLDRYMRDKLASRFGVPVQYRREIAWGDLLARWDIQGRKKRKADYGVLLRDFADDPLLFRRL